MPRLETDGKFFKRSGERVLLKVVTYGPFPEDCGHEAVVDFPRIRELGFNAVRTYELPDREVLDRAAENGLLVFAGLQWGQGIDFLSEGGLDHYREAKKALVSWLKKEGRHEAVGAVLVGNEIPPDMVRWMGPEQVRAALDELIATGKKVRPECLFAYANFPTTEYLEPERADFTAFNLYLEDAEDVESYLARLHHVAGDRPVMLTEFGYDTQRGTEERQRDLLRDFLEVTRRGGVAGVTVYAWSDWWKNNGEVVEDWSFGLLRRDGSEKAAVGKLREKLPVWDEFPETEEIFISVIVCTRNGGKRIANCLRSLERLRYPFHEVIVVDDGSTDGTAEVVQGFEKVRLIRQEASGLSAARNKGALAAKGEVLAYTDDDCEVDEEWLSWLAYAFSTQDAGAIGGPNLPPPAGCEVEAIVSAAPGAPTHVMLRDRVAEHLPGCHLAVRREAFDKVGGFRPVYETAGDDVDFCWRLREAGCELGFAAASFVWHHRRPSVRRYLKQQIGYGRAEALLFQDHPEKFTNGEIRWQGVVYAGSVIGYEGGDVIYHGARGEAPYQMLQLNRQPVRPLPLEYDTEGARKKLKRVSVWQRRLRRWARWWYGGPKVKRQKSGRYYRDDVRVFEEVEFSLWTTGERGRDELYDRLEAEEWRVSEEQEWDLEMEGARLLAATERGEGQVRKVLVRVSYCRGNEEYWMGRVREAFDRE